LEKCVDFTKSDGEYVRLRVHQLTHKNGI
jgi:hypothetical protein